LLNLAFTSNKKAIRQLWDRPIIENFRQEINTQLAYFGLPGPDIQDLIDWKDSLSHITCIEYLGKNGQERESQLQTISKLMSNLILKGFSHNSEVRKGSLEDIIFDGTDIDGDRPALLILERNRPATMSYDIHNWDFQSGLGFKNKTGKDKRVEAIKKCFELQRGHPFLFLLTLNVRHNLKDEPTTYLQGKAKEINSNTSNILNWYSQKGGNDGSDHYRTKAVVPLVIRDCAQMYAFDCFAYPPVYYQGPIEHLLHFVFWLRPTGMILPSSSSQQISDVIELPLVEVINGRFRLASEQHPGLDMAKAMNLIQNLPLHD